MPIVSLHLPKTAGSSLRAALEQHFGPRLLLDYGDLPLNTPRPRREWHALRQAWHLRHAGLPEGVACVHGHFLPLKYAWIGRRPLGHDQSPAMPRFVTWLREPVERLISHYRYWMLEDDPSGLPPLHQRVVREQWSLERFCLGPELRNLYHQFLFGFPPRRFAFVGLVERMEDDFARFEQRFLGGAGRLALPRLRMGRADLAERHLGEGPLRRRIEAYHRRDLELYRRFAGARTG